MKKLEASWPRLERVARKQLGYKDGQQLTPEQEQKLNSAVMKLTESDKGYRDAMTAYRKAFDEMRPLMDQPEMHGFVWVYLHK
jgi:hypothetical protein